MEFIVKRHELAKENRIDIVLNAGDHNLFINGILPEQATEYYPLGSRFILLPAATRVETKTDKTIDLVERALETVNA